MLRKSAKYVQLSDAIETVMLFAIIVSAIMVSVMAPFLPSMLHLFQHNAHRIHTLRKTILYQNDIRIRTPSIRILTDCDDQHNNNIKILS